jgi:hypothetical protein
LFFTQTSFTFALLINKAHTNIAKMRRLKQAPSLTEMLRGLKEGEGAKVHTKDCKETVLRNIAYRLKKEGLLFRVNAEEGACIITRIS